MKEINLSEGWQLTERVPDRSLAEQLASEDGWLPARVPGTVHEDLLRAGRIPDPFYGDNERLVQWVGERDWLYRCRFTVPDGFLGGRCRLRCEGLDTFASVRLNGAALCESDNMFLPVEADAGPLLRRGENELSILFSSAARVAREREARSMRMRVWNGDASRVYARKAQYHWGWDWGPCLITAGPYRSVRLLCFDARIGRLVVTTRFAGPRAEVHVDLQAEGDGEEAAVALYDPSGHLVGSREAPLRGDALGCAFQVPDPQRWWPAGLGGQPLYRVEASLRRGLEVHRRALRLGLRDLELVQQPLTAAPGRSFHFAVNGRPFFAGGANWIPADSFVTRVDGARYRRLLELARAGGVSMLRIWGGGVYEEDLFYDLCDELGLLVWQDFMFACGLYPDESWFVDSVRAEAEAQVERLRHHASIALWCGNNEDYSIAASLSAFPPQRRRGDAPPFPARLLYEKVLAEVCAAQDPSRPYWPGSPHSGSEDLDPNDPHVGDRHSWDVWHGPRADYQDYARYAGRFVSEFGMQALPALETLRACLPPAELRPGSAGLHFHNKATDGPERLAGYLQRNLPRARDLDEEVYLSQLLQAEALGWAVRSFRRGFGGPGDRRVGGALVWQWNDCWPVVSWAVLDYALVPKAGYYALRRELLPLVLGLAREEGAVALWAASSLAEEVEGELELRAFALSGAPLLIERRPVQLLANQATELGRFAPPAGVLVIGARLLRGGAAVAHARLWPEPLKDLPLEDPQLSCVHDGPDALRLSARRPLKGLWLEADGVRFEDNGLDLLPDEEVRLGAPGLAGRAPRRRWLAAGGVCEG